MAIDQDPVELLLRKITGLGPDGMDDAISYAKQALGILAARKLPRNDVERVAQAITAASRIYGNTHSIARAAIAAMPPYPSAPPPASLAPR